MKTKTNLIARLRPAAPLLDEWQEPIVSFAENDPLQVSVQFKESGLFFLRAHLERDQSIKIRGWNPVGFEMLELIDIEALLTRHPDREILQGGDNVLLTYPQLRLLVRYVAMHYEQAIEHEDSVRQNALGDALDALTRYLTFLNPLYLPVHGQFSYPVNSFRVLRIWVGAVFTGHHDGESFQAFQAGR